MPKRRPEPDTASSRELVLVVVSEAEPGGIMEARRRLEAEIVLLAQDAMGGFLRAHPTYAGDERNKAGMELFMSYVDAVLETFNGYEIEYRTKKGE